MPLKLILNLVWLNIRLLLHVKSNGIGEKNNVTKRAITKCGSIQSNRDTYGMCQHIVGNMKMISFGALVNKIYKQYSQDYTETIRV